jgi:uncharacterized protein (TIGR00369 family)
MHGHSPCGQLIGTRIRKVDWEGLALELEYDARPEFCNRIGTVAGAMLAAMLDSATGLVAMVVLPEEQFAVHTELRVSYHRPARPGRLTARARVLEQEGRTVRTRADLAGEDGVVVAAGEATLRAIRKPVG